MRIVGAGSAPPTGNQWARIGVPSNEVMTTSLATSATGSASTGETVAPCSHAAPAVAAGSEESGGAVRTNAGRTIASVPAETSRIGPGHYLRAAGDHSAIDTEDEAAGRDSGAGGDEDVLDVGDLVDAGAADLADGLGDSVHPVDVRLAELTAVRVQ